MALLPAVLLVKQAAGAEGTQVKPADPTADPTALSQAEARIERWQTWVHSPQASAERQQSKHAYADQTAASAQSTDAKAFPGQVSAPGMRALEGTPSGERLARKLSSNTALLENSHGQRAVLASLLPLDGTTPGGRSAPLDLSLEKRGGSFVPASTLVPTSAPAATDGELSFPSEGFGVRFAAGAPVTGQQAGGSVLYPNIGGVTSDTDAVVRPMPLGAEISYMLRSQSSAESQTLSFDLPTGWSLHDPGDQSGAVEIVSPAGKVMAGVLPPVAVDAQGQTVPAVYQIKDATQLVLTVSHKSGDFAYPILVDPYVEVDDQGTSVNSYWGQASSNSSAFTAVGYAGESGWKMHSGTYYPAGTWTQYQYTAPAGAYVYELIESGVGHNAVQSLEYGGIYQYNYAGWEPGVWWEPYNSAYSGSGADFYDGGSESNTEFAYCARSGCTYGPSSGIGSGSANGNFAVFGLEEWHNYTQPSNYANDVLTDAQVYLSDSVTPQVSVLSHSGYVPGRWVHDAVDSLTVKASVPNGLGVENVHLGGALPAADQQDSVSNCEGTLPWVCPQDPTAYFNYSTADLPEGSNTLWVQATTAGDGISDTNQPASRWQVNIDRTAPTIAVSGSLASTSNGNITDQPYQLTVNAADGSGSTASAGVKYVGIYLDGQAVSGFSANSCSPGPCSSSGTWTMNGGDWAAGPHQVTVVAVDGAGNQSTKTINITVHHAATQTVGPGDLNLENGEFSLSSSDVSLPGFSGDLNLTRTYASEHLSAGASGPFGPGWALALPQGSQVGSFQSLAAAPDGGVVLTDAGGNQSKWTAADNNTFTPPAGYEAFQLTGPATPAGTPQEYTAGLTSGAQPVQMTLGRDGALWFTEWSADQIGRIDPSSHSVTEYKVPTASALPYGITVGSDGALWFTEYGTNKIGRLDPSKASAGTANGMTEYAVPTANSNPLDIVSGPDHALWFTETSAGKIGRIDPSSGSIAETAVAGSQPRGLVVGPDGALWFGDNGNNEIGTISTGATPNVTEYPIPTGGADVVWMTVGTDGAMWFSEYGANKIGRVTTSGTITEYVVPTANSNPLGIVSGADGKIWFDEASTSKVASLDLSAASPGTPKGITEYTLPTSGAFPYGLVSGPDGNIWVPEEGSTKIANLSLGAYQLKDTDGYTRTFTPTSAGQYAPTQDTAPISGGSTVTSSSSYVTVPGSNGTTTLVAEPVQSSAAAPGVTCGLSNATTTRGCRTLTYTYATSTTATSTAPGDYTGRLAQIAYTAWDPSAGAMKTIPVAQYQYDTEGRLVAEWDPRVSPALKTTYTYDSAGHVTGMTPPGLAAWTFNYGTVPGDSTAGRLLSVSRPDPANGTETTTVVYNVPLSGSSAPHAMGSSDVSAWAQTDVPVSATAIFPPDEVPSATPPSDYNRATIYYVDGQGNTVNVAAPGGRISTTEYDSHFNVVRTLSPANWTTALAAGANSASQAQLLDTQYTYASNGIDLTDKLGPQHVVQLVNGSQVQARTHTHYTFGDTSATAAHKPTQVTEGAQVAGQSGDQDVRTTTTAYDDAVGKPTAVTTDPGGLNIVNTTVYDDSTGNPIEMIQPGKQNGGDAHETDTVYYSAAPNANHPSCGGHPEWANLPCEKLPAAQPGSASTPAFIQSVTGHSTPVSSITVTPSKAVTVGDRMIVEVGIWSDGIHATAASVTDSAGNTYTELLHYAAVEGTEMSVWSAPITAGGGTTPTITVTPTSSAYIGVAALEYAGLSTAAGSGALDTQAHATSTTTTAATVASGATPATSGPNELALGLYVDSGFADTLNHGSGFTQRVNVSPTSDMEFVAEDQIVGAGTTPNATVKTGANTTWLMATLVFKPTVLPDLPTATYAYNMWGQPTATTDSSDGQTRTTTTTYDSAGRPTSVAVNATAGDPTPTLTYGYDPTTGLRTTERASDGRTITTAYDSLARTTSYTDADGNVSTYSYDVDGRMTSLNDGKGKQTYGYDATTGDLTSIQDSAAGTFSASYDADGRLTEQIYPNGMTADYGYDATGVATGVTYAAPSGCTSSCTWFDDQIRPSIHDEWLHEQSTVYTRDYVYDATGRLTETDDTRSGPGCTIRLYAYDVDSNRLSLTTRGPNADKSCASSGGTVAGHTYDAADRLTDGGVVYDVWGNIVSLPARDAGGQAVSNTYYATDRLHTQTQNGKTLTYNLDASNRVRERITSGTSASDEIEHYSDTSDSPSWVISGTTWTRNIQGIDANLAATQTNGGTIIFQIIDLHGDVVGTVANKTTATPTLAAHTDEFGVPYSGATPRRYDYLGSKRRTTALPTGIIDMGEREYVPALGRFEQPDPVSGGSANDYDYADQDPVTGQDLSGSLDNLRRTITAGTYHWSFCEDDRAMIGETIITEVQWCGGINFSGPAGGRKGHVTGSVTVIVGAAIRVKFDVRAFNEDLDQTTGAVKPTDPTRGYAEEATMNGGWWPYFHGTHYQIKFAIFVWANGARNPSSTNGSYASEVVSTPTLTCGPLPGASTNIQDCRFG